MGSIATRVFLGILFTGILPTKVLAESLFKISPNQTKLELSAVKYVELKGDRSLTSSQFKLFEDQKFNFDTRSDLTIELDNHSRIVDLYSDNTAAFKSGVVTWQGENRLGSMKFDGKFDDSARFTKGKAYLATPTAIGLVDLSVFLSDRIQPIKTVTGWQADTPLGSLVLKGTFDQEITFTGGNVAWNAKTKLGAVKIDGKFDRETNFNGGNAAWSAKSKLGAISINGKFDHETKFNGGNAVWDAKTSIASFSMKGNFDRDTKFTGGNFKVGSKALIGSFQANIKIDESKGFNGANASWNTNLLFGSNVGVSGKFDDTNTFTGGSIKVGAKSSLGTMGVKANLDRDTNFTSGSAFWKTKTKLGSINLNADLKQDGNFASKLGFEFPL